MEEEKKYGSTVEEFSMIDLLVRELRGDSFHKLRISRIEEIPEREAEYATIKRPLPEAIHSWLLRQRVRLYCHQHQTLEAFREGKDIILTTPTSSGKTLSFNLPVMEALIQDPQATALYIYPAKALSNDQLKTLKSMEQEMGLSLRPALYDGDTPQSLRPGIRKNSRIVLTNPYELHMILPWHTKWASFYSHLKAIVVDEAVSARAIQDCIRQNGGELLREVWLFDVYRGRGIAEGRKSLALGLILQDFSRNLTDSVVEETVSGIIAGLAEQFDATLRV